VLDYNTYMLLNFPVKRHAKVAIVIFVMENMLGIPTPHARTNGVLIIVHRRLSTLRHNI
jgi:hypothetical protein